MHIRVRKAGLNDAKKLPEIERSAAKAFLDVKGLEYLADTEVMSEAQHCEFIRAGTEWVAISATDQISGFLAAEEIGTELHIHELSVHVDQQGKGIGTSLLRAVSECANAEQLSALTLTTFRDVPWNAPFYGRFGFEILADTDLDTRLSGILTAEANAGLPADRRCAMRLSLSRTAQGRTSGF